MIHKKLIAILAFLLMLLGTLLPGAEKTDKKKESEKTIIVIRDNGDLHIDMKELRAALKQLKGLEKLENLDIQINLKALHNELAALPGSLKAMQKQLEKLDNLEIRVDMKGLEKSLETMHRGLEKLDTMNLDVIVEKALKSLDGLEVRIDAAIDAAFESRDEI